MAEGDTQIKQADMMNVLHIVLLLLVVVEVILVVQG